MWLNIPQFFGEITIKESPPIYGKWHKIINYLFDNTSGLKLQMQTLPHQYFPQRFIINVGFRFSFKVDIKLDRVGSVDNRPSTD